jgi:uncharacterized peroxidase-related enzyme
LPEPSLFLSQIEVLAHTPGILQGLTEVYRWFGTQGRVPRRYHELAIVVVSNLNRCTYCVSHHTPFALELGCSEAQLAALAQGAWRDQPDLFDPAELAVIEYADAVTREPWKVSDDLFARLRQHCDETQIVELTARTALCSFWNKFDDALRPDLEPGIQEVALHRDDVRCHDTTTAGASHGA